MGFLLSFLIGLALFHFFDERWNLGYGMVIIFALVFGSLGGYIDRLRDRTKNSKKGKGDKNG